MTSRQRPLVEGFYGKRTGGIQYMVADAATRHRAAIAPVLVNGEKSGTALLLPLASLCIAF